MNTENVEEKNDLFLETNLSAKFVTTVVPDSEEKQQSLDAMNMHLENITEQLQSVFRLLIIEMMTLKQEHYTGEKKDA
jgi:hypothetical protein